MASLPDLSMQNGRRASHHPMLKFATMGLLVRQNSEKKESRVSQTVHNPESLTQGFYNPEILRVFVSGWHPERG